MNKTSDQLNKISNSLVALSKQVDKISRQILKLKDTKAVLPKAVKSSAKKKAPAKAETQLTVLDSVFDIIKRSKKGVTIAKLKEKTRLESRQISNALYKLAKKDKIVSKERGSYLKK